MRRLLVAVVAETDLARPADPAAAAAAPAASGWGKYFGGLAKVASLSTSVGSRLVAATEGPPPDTRGAPVSDHFRPLKSAVAEVDGAPPALDTLAAALGALSKEIEDVATAANPDQAIKDKGGLGQFAAAVASQAAGLPPPVDEWLRGAIGDTVSITKGAVVSQLNAVWAADVRGWCRRLPGAIRSTRRARPTSAPTTSRGCSAPAS